MNRVPTARALAARSIATFALASAAAAQGNNLLVNPSFESGLTGWTVTGPVPQVAVYGASGLPSQAVSDRIGGSASLLHDAGGNATVEQTIALSPPSGDNLEVGGYFGGGATDEAWLQIEFHDGSGTSLGLHTLETVTASRRNFETVLMVRERVIAIPAAATEADFRIRFTNQCCDGGSFAAADACFARYTSRAVVPPALALDTELLVNPDFEQGWSPASPLTLVDPQGWEGTSGTSCNVEQYSNSSAIVPSVLVSDIIDGGANLLTDGPGGASLRQVLAVGGNAAQFACGTGPVLRVAAFLGGVGASLDAARVEIRFLSSAQVVLKSETLQPVTRAARNSETVVLARVLESCVPAGTWTIVIEVVFQNECCDGGVFGSLDNISARLSMPTPQHEVHQGVNLVLNAGFEEGSLPGSPLQLLEPDGWAGGNTASVRVGTYGEDATVPAPGFAQTNGLGGLVLRDRDGGASLWQRFDLLADGAAIDQGLFIAEVSAWLGGNGASNDRAQVKVQQLNAIDGPVGTPEFLGPVTAAERGNITTLLPRSAAFQILPGVRAISLTVTFTNECCDGGIFGLADRVRLQVRDVTVSDGVYCSGDGGSTPCPCANSGDLGHGCANGLHAQGCRLVASGSASIASGDLFLHASMTVPYQPGLFFQGDNAVNGGNGFAFGDGLRCAGGNLVRLQARPANPRGEASTTVPLAAVGGVSPGDVKRYQWWYRDPFGSPCGAQFNLSNGVEVTWLP